MKSLALMVCAALLAGCAVAPSTVPPAPLPLHDEAFAPPSERIDAADAFAFSAAMRAFADAAPTPSHGSDPRRVLVERLYRGRAMVLTYDATRTRNAAEAFDAGAGNCLSLVLMTAAFAKAAGLPVAYRSVLVDETWSRSGGLLLGSGHVQVVLGRPASPSRLPPGADPEALIVDFLPADEMRGLATRAVSEATVTAMYMNNRAAEALAAGRIDDAYAWARGSVRQDPGFTAAQNTLGVVYLRRGQPQWARDVFVHVLQREPAHAMAMGNLVGALRALGRDDEAQVWADRLLAQEPFPPYHFFSAGLRAMQAHDARAARELFRRELARQPFNAEVHFWLARANAELGNAREARRHLEQARQNSTTSDEQALYAAKLDQLLAHRSPEGSAGLRRR